MLGDYATWSFTVFMLRELNFCGFCPAPLPAERPVAAVGDSDSSTAVSPLRMLDVVSTPNPTPHPINLFNPSYFISSITVPVPLPIS